MSEVKHAVVTGGGSGIGRAVVDVLREQGYDVSVCGREAAKLEQVVAEVGADHVFTAQCDVADEAQVEAFVESAVARFGPVSVVVNCAGRSGGGVTADIATQLWDDVINVNLRSVFLVTRAVLNAGGMRNLKWGRIINIASTAGKQGVVLGAPYSASKHGVVGFTKALGNELGPTGITVNAVCPGYVETPMAQKVRQGYMAAFNKSEEEIMKQFTAKIPLGRYSTPEEVAGLVGYLVTPTANSITSQALNVCGGLGNF